MTTDEGTPKRRRGLFRRDRGDAAATADERKGADAFDDPWSASAWDDWDDDFTNGGARSSVPPAAAPRPEAVDAWLQSEADDFETAARRNTKRWGGDANRPADTATTGLRSLRAETEATLESEATVLVPGGLGLETLRAGDSDTTEPLSFSVADAAGKQTNAPDPDPNDHPSSDWATDPDLLAIDESTLHDNVVTAEDEAVDDAVDGQLGGHVAAIPASDDEPSDLAVDEPLSPIWEPVEAFDPLLTKSPDVPGPDTTVPGIDAGTKDQIEEPSVSLPEGPRDAAQGVLDPPEFDAHIEPTGEDDNPSALTQGTPSDDELMLSDALEPEQLELEDLTVLDEEPLTATAPRAGWAPNLDEPSGFETPPPADEVEDSGSSVRDGSHSAFAPAADFVRDLEAAKADPFVAAEEVRVRLPGFADPVPPQQPPARFVTVSVVSDDDHDDQGETSSAVHQPTAESFVGTEAASGDRSPAPSRRMAEGAGKTAPAAVRNAPADASSARPVAAPTPKITSRRWAALAAEFGSDGDLDDSFPTRPRDDAPAPTTAAPSATVDNDTARPFLETAAPEATVTDDTLDTAGMATDPGIAPDTAEATGPDVDAPVTDAVPASGDLMTVEPELEVAAPTSSASTSTPDAVPTIDVVASAAAADETAVPEVDPWAQPPVRAARPGGSAPTPATGNRPNSSASSADDPWTRPPQRLERARTSVGAAPVGPAGVAAGSPGSRRPTATRPSSDRPYPSRPLEPTTVIDEGVAPEISGFAGTIGTALVGFAIVRIVLTLLGDQPVIPTRYTGREASLLRIGESFGSAGSAWPVALAVGTVLLTLPSFLAIRSHLRRWAPVVGLAAATGVVAIAIGALRFVAGRRLGSASTVKLISDVVVGPVGFGLVTVVAVAMALRWHRR